MKRSLVLSTALALISLGAFSLAVQKTQKPTSPRNRPPLSATPLGKRKPPAMPRPSPTPTPTPR